MRYILLFVSITVFFDSFGQALKTVKKVENEVLQLKEKHDSLQVKLDSVLKITQNLNDNIEGERKEIVELKNHLDSIEKSSSYSSDISKLGAIILLIGLFIEIIGATLLAGADLSNEVEPIKSAKLEYTQGDLAFEDKLKGNVMTFYGIIGSFLLVIGFCLQFSGTIIIVGLKWYFTVGAIALAIISGFVVLLFLAGQNVHQPLNVKFKIVRRNLERIILFPIKQALAGKHNLVCEICMKKVPYSQAEVWYKQENNSDRYPYLYPPYGFYIGHPNCLTEVYPEKETDRKRPDNIEDIEDVESFMSIPHPLFKLLAADFYSNHLDKLYQWNEKRLSDLQRKRRSRKKIIDETEVCLRNLKVELRGKKV